MSTPSGWYIATASGMSIDDQARFYVIASKPSWWRRLLRRLGR